MKTILIIEDDENLSRGISFTFEKDGYSVICANTFTRGWASFDAKTIDIVLLDLTLPDGNGLKLCQCIREISNTPIIILTACDMEIDEVSGLMAGADDYITKPFSLSILRARVEAALRREDNRNRHIITSGRYRLDTNFCKLYCDENEVALSSTEYRLISYFMANEGQVLAKEQLLSALWDDKGTFVEENTLPVNISRLRAKVEENPKQPKIIKTIHGIGYVWVRE